MLKKLINTLGRGFATLRNGASTLELFPAPDVKIPPALDSLDWNMNQSYKSLPNGELSPWEQDSINLARDWERIGADFRRVMNRFPLDKDLWNSEKKQKNIQEIREKYLRSVVEAGTRTTLEVNGVKIAFRYCPPGVYSSGNSSYEEEKLSDKERRVVTIDKGFWICETPTTQELWDAVGVQKQKASLFKGAKRPVENVNWFECETFVEKLNKLGIVPSEWRLELPTEPQWEYACRAGATDATYEVSLDDYAWYGDNSGNSTHIVGAKKSNMWGIYDMLGNVWEWTGTRSTSDESLLVLRGGSWRSIASFCRSEIRDVIDPSTRDGNLGFRMVLVPSRTK